MVVTLVYIPTNSVQEFPCPKSTLAFVLLCITKVGISDYGGVES